MNMSDHERPPVTTLPDSPGNPLSATPPETPGKPHQCRLVHLPNGLCICTTCFTSTVYPEPWTTTPEVVS